MNWQRLPRGPIAPLHPLLPLLFCLSSAFMSFKTFDYAAEQTPRGLAASAAVLGIEALLSWAES